MLQYKINEYYQNKVPDATKRYLVVAASFPEEALASQVGLDNGQDVDPWYKTEGLSPQDYMQINLDSL